MAKAQLKILLFLMALGITLGCMAAAYYIYDRILSPDRRIQEEIAKIKKVERPRIDPGAKRFEAAIDLVKRNQIEQGRDALFKLIQQFPESPTCVEAKRIIGEINLDLLFSPDQKAGRKDHIVQPGESLALIANRQNTTMDMLIRINGLMNTILQPGDHLTIIPLDFNLVVNLSARTVTLRHKVGDKEFFFKEYPTEEIRLPPNLRAPVEMEIKGKAAHAGGKTVLPTDAGYIEADKWLPGSRGGVVLRTQPPKPAETTPTPPKNNAPPEIAVPTEYGVFLAREDLEELFPLVRNGSKLYFIR